MGGKPRANPPVCWYCDRRLAQGGYSYVTVKAEDGHEHPMHRDCARKWTRGERPSSREVERPTVHDLRVDEATDSLPCALTTCPLEPTR
jgi:hypothetical protein